MSCQINLRSLIGASGVPSNGGTWNINRTIAGLQVNGGPPASYSPAAPGSNIFPTDNPLVDFSLVPYDPLNTNPYIFTYTLGGEGCFASASATITLVEGAVAGISRSFTVCPTNNFNYVLWDFLRGAGIDPMTGQQTSLPGTPNEVTATNGTTFIHPTNVPNNNGWTVTNGSPGAAYVIGSNPPFSNTFNPNGLSAPGNYQFTYTVRRAGTTEPNCANCQASTTVSFTITAAPNAGVNANVTVCNDQNIL